MRVRGPSTDEYPPVTDSVIGGARRQHRYADENLGNEEELADYEEELDQPRYTSVSPRFISADELRARHQTLMLVALMWFGTFCIVLMMGASVIKYLGYMFG